MVSEKIFESKISYILYPFSFLYEILVKLRLALYKKGFLSQNILPGFVVSVGNLSVGGTGKTPLVIKIAEWAKQKGYRVGIISRGYRGNYKDMLLVSDGKELKSTVFNSGDEPYLMARRLREVAICVSKNRAKAGRFISRRYGIDFFILDDGFQHLKLKRDLDIVLLSKRDILNKRVLPSGPLREPLSHLKRADICITTDKIEKKDILENLENLVPEKRLFFATYITKKAVFPKKGEVALDFLRGKRVMAFAGISRPERFKATLEKLGAEVIFFKRFPDHHWFSKKDLAEIFSLKKRLRAELVLTTEKDWVRLVDKNKDIGYIEVENSSEKEDRFFAIIEDADAHKKNTGQSNQLDR